MIAIEKAFKAIVWIVVGVAFIACAEAIQSANSAEKARSGRWETTRDRYIEVHAFCEYCGRARSTVVHHVVPFHEDPERELDVANFLALCDQCHLRQAHLGDFKAWNPLIREEIQRNAEMVKARPYTEADAAKFIERFRSNYQTAP